MRHPEDLQHAFEELAERYAREGPFRNRDHCFVLAADAALAAGRADDAERLRQRLLQANPYHMLRPYASMTEAMQLKDLRDYVEDLRRQWPSDVVAKLIHEAPSSTPPSKPDVAPRPEPTIPRKTQQAPKAYEPALAAVSRSARELDEPAPPPTRRPATLVMAPKPALSPYEPPAFAPASSTSQLVPPFTQWLSTMLFFVAVLFSGGVFFLAFVWPLLD